MQKILLTKTLRSYEQIAPYHVLNSNTSNIHINILRLK